MQWFDQKAAAAEVYGTSGPSKKGSWELSMLGSGYIGTWLVYADMNRIDPTRALGSKVKSVAGDFD